MFGRHWGRNMKEPKKVLLEETGKELGRNYELKLDGIYGRDL